MYEFILVNLYTKISKKKKLHPVGISTRDQYPRLKSSRSAIHHPQKTRYVQIHWCGIVIPIFCMAGIFCMSQKNSQQVFLLALRKNTLCQFFPSFACFAHKKLSAESRPSAESWLVAKVSPKKTHLSNSSIMI